MLKPGNIGPSSRFIFVSHRQDWQRSSLMVAHSCRIAVAGLAWAASQVFVPIVAQARSSAEADAAKKSQNGRLTR